MKSKAFTVIELMIVVAVIAIIAAIAVPNLLTDFNRLYSRAAKGEHITPEEKKKLITYLEINKQKANRWRAEYGPLSWEKKITEQEDPEAESLRKEIERLKQQSKTTKKTVSLPSKTPSPVFGENLPRRYSYQIKSVKQDYKWRYIVYRDLEEIHVGDTSRECEKIVELLKEAHKNEESLWRNK